MQAKLRGAVPVGIAGGLATLAALAVAFAPMQRTVSSVTDTTGRTTTTSMSESLLESQGAGVLVAAAVPVALTLLPLIGYALGRQRVFRALLIGVTVLMGLFVLATGFSIGLFYLPALIALIVATAIAVGTPNVWAT